jgi:hypothetical protein
MSKQQERITDLMSILKAHTALGLSKHLTFTRYTSTSRLQPNLTSCNLPTPFKKRLPPTYKRAKTSTMTLPRPAHSSLRDQNCYRVKMTARDESHFRFLDLPAELRPPPDTNETVHVAYCEDKAIRSGQ